jgi:hypothetical protein
MKVKDHLKFCCFDYESNISNTNFQLGDVVTKVSEDGTEIGVVIQLHDDGDFRTDMFGNASPSEVTLSTIVEVTLHRKVLLEEIVFELTLEQTRDLFISGSEFQLETIEYNMEERGTIDTSDYGDTMNRITNQKIF